MTEGKIPEFINRPQKNNATEYFQEKEVWWYFSQNYLGGKSNDNDEWPKNPVKDFTSVSINVNGKTKRFW